MLDAAAAAADADDDDDDDDDDDTVTFEVPEGFVKLPKPAELPSNIDDLFILQHWTVSWELGKFELYRSSARKFKYSIIWDDARRNAELKLEKYYEDGDRGRLGAAQEGRDPRRIVIM